MNTHQLQYKYPPQIQKCNNHRLASRIFKGLDQGQFAAQCQCCQRKIGLKEDTGQCCYDNLKLALIGPGIPLLFNFLKNCILLLVVLAVSFVAYSLFTNLKGGDCSVKGSCSDTAFDLMSIINKITSPQYLSMQNYVLLIFVVINIFLMHYFRFNFRKIEDQCDDMITSPSDYALILRRLPEGASQEDIEKMVEERRKFLTPEERQKTDNLRIVNIVMSFSMTEYKRIKAENKQQFTKLLEEGKHEQFKPKKLPDLEQPSSIAIIVFSKQQSKQLFKYNPNIFQKLLQCIWTPCIPLSDFRVKGENISVERAPEPDDIVWENSKISLKGAICRKTIYSFFSILLLIMGGGIQFGLAVAQTKVSQDSNTQLLMSTVSSLSISVINAVIQVFLVFTSHKQRNETLTQFNTVLMVKISFFQFLNTGVFVVVANFLADPNNFSLSKGFVLQITQVMIINAIVPNLSLFILTYCEIVQKIKRCLIERGTIKASQMEANMVFQGPTVQLPYKYAYIFKTIWLTAFYAPLAPVVVPISIGGLLLNYIIQKLLFGKVYSSPCRISSMVNDSAIQLMQYFSLIISLGEFIIFLYLLQFKPELLPLNWSIPIYAAIVISVLNLLLPMDALNKKLFKLPSDNMVFPNYEKVEERFQVTYEMTNPGYVCKKKRNRDLLMVGQLFGNKGVGIQMTNLGLLPGMGASPANVPIIGNQDQLYKNSNNFNNPPPNNSNPFSAMFTPSKSPTNINSLNLNLPVSGQNNTQAIPLNQINPILPNPIGFMSPSAQHHAVQSPNNISINEQTNERRNLIQNQQAPLNHHYQNGNPPSFNGNNNSMMTSITGAFPNPYQNNSMMQPNQNFGFTNPINNLAGSSVTMAPPPFSNQPPGFNMIPNSGYYNPGQNWGGPINIAPQSQNSYSSTKQVRKALQMEKFK